MPIKGLTDRETLEPRLPRLGKLRKGGARPEGGKRPGKDLDHFRFTADDADVVAAFRNAYGDTPRLVNVVLFYETLERNFSTWIELWDATGLVWRSDGENQVLWRDGDRYKRGTRPHTDDPKQSVTGRLEFVVPELVQQGFVGTVTLETHSNHDLRNIGGVLLAAEQERGSLRGTQFVLRRVPQTISVPGFGDRKGKRSRVEKWLCRLEPPRKMLQIVDDAPALPAPVVDEATGEIVDDEAPPDPDARDRVRFKARFNELYNEATALGLDPGMLPTCEGLTTMDGITEAGKALADIVSAAKASGAQEAAGGDTD